MINDDRICSSCKKSMRKEDSFILGYKYVCCECYGNYLDEKKKKILKEKQK